MEQISGGNAIFRIARKVTRDNPESIEDYKAGKKRSMDFLADQTMEASKGKRSPQIIN